MWKLCLSLFRVCLQYKIKPTTFKWMLNLKQHNLLLELREEIMVMKKKKYWA